VHGALIRYRVMAFVVGTALLLLTVVVIFQLLGVDVKVAEEVVAPTHGYLYLVYLVTAADLARRAHWRLGRILLVVAAGFVPFLAFIVEHRVYQQMQAEWAAEAAEQPGGVASGAERADRQGPVRPPLVSGRPEAGSPGAHRCRGRRQRWSRRS
jgi:integral membrane protein